MIRWNLIKYFREKRLERIHMEKHQKIYKEKLYFDECVYNNPSTNGTGYGGMILKCDECDFSLAVVSAEFNEDDYDMKDGKIILKDETKYTEVSLLKLPPIWKYK